MRTEQLSDNVTPKFVTIYALCEPVEKWRTGRVRYVGKTVRTPWQRVRAHSYVAKRSSPRLPVQRWLKKQMEAGNPFHIRHLERVCMNADWAERERFWIAKYRQEQPDLLNLTEGGEGTHGHARSLETKTKISQALKSGASFSCLKCGSNFWRKRSAIDKGNTKFCSRMCSNTRSSA